MLGTLEKAQEMYLERPVSARVGRGAYREVFRDGDVVYKVGSQAANLQEAENYHILLKKSLSLPSLRIPETSVHEVEPGVVVVAQEFVDGTLVGELPCEERKNYAEGFDSLAQTNLDDMHSGNIIVDRNGIVVPIDLGASISEFGPSTDPRRHAECGAWCECPAAKARRAVRRERRAEEERIRAEEVAARAQALVDAGMRPRDGYAIAEVYCLHSCCWEKAE